MQHKRTAFTLIELLVVVAVIVILLAIMIPALSRARDSARSVKCLANVKQIGMACAIYVAENDNRLFASNRSSNPGNMHWQRMVAALLGEKVNTSGANSQPVAGARKIMQCPTALFLYYPSKDPWPTYAMNNRNDGAGTFRDGLKMNTVKQPSMVVAIGDAVWDADSGWQNDTWVSDGDLAYHHSSTQMHNATSGSFGQTFIGNGFTNGVFLDWHAEPFKQTWFSSPRRVLAVPNYGE